MLKGLVGWEIESEKIINFIFTEINKKESSGVKRTYLNVRKELERVYRNKNARQLEEDCEYYKGTEKALKNTSAKDFTFIAIQIITVSITILMGLMELFGPGKDLAMAGGLFLIVIIAMFRLAQCRMQNKAKRLVYYDMVIRVIDEEISNRKKGKN